MSTCHRCKSPVVICNDNEYACRACGFDVYQHDSYHRTHLMDYYMVVGIYWITWSVVKEVVHEIFIHDSVRHESVFGANGSLLYDDPIDKQIFDAFTFDITEDEIKRLLRLWEMLQ